ncbi:MAG TPA: hypothetical protein VLF59_04105 [Candidatus Saccharimonadales bacterium]|nr:hypothetical protein [Candidatus Saccharimonadales bacterium]
MALVDPFIPQPRQHRARSPQTTASIGASSRPLVQTTAGSASFIQPSKPHIKTFEAPIRRVGRPKLILQGIATALLAIVLGLAAGAQPVGEVAIAVYTIIALCLRFSSRISFALALIAFAMIMLLRVLRPDSGLAANFAVYAFLLLVAGTLSQALEMRQAVKWRKWRRQPKGKRHA